MDLSNFNLRDILLSALKSEIESRDIYNKLASKVKNFFLRERLGFLANEEDKHKRFFEELFKKKFPGEAISPPEKTPVPLPSIEIKNEEMPISEIFQQAMDAEKSAYEFYISFSKRFSLEDPINKMLIYIAEMEKGHYKILEIEKENAEKFEAYDIVWPMMHIGA